MRAELDNQQRLSEELAPGERVLWRGAPDSRRWLYPQDAVLIPFSLMWGGFAIFWEVGVLSSSGARGTVLFPLWGVPFALIGLYLIVGRFPTRRWVRRHTQYAVTDRRAISIAPSWPRGDRSTSVWFGSYPPLDKRLGRDGAGTLWIGPFPSSGRWLSTEPGWPGGRRASGGGVVFADIADAAAVYSQIRERLSDATAAGMAQR
jgi:hypothetical protein